MTTNYGDRPGLTVDERYEVEVSAWSGNVRPWSARVYRVSGDERTYIGKSGFCRTESAARRAGEAIAAQAVRS